MSSQSFVHLQVHSEYSMLQSTARIDRLIRKAQEMGQTALALTDHGNMFGILEFYTAAQKAGIKPILGCDLYMSPDSRRNTNYAPGQTAWHQVIALAQNSAGYKNLMALCSTGHLEGHHHKPRVDREAIEQRRKGLLFLLPNLDSEVGHHFLRGQEKKAREILDFFAATCGRDRVFLVVQNHGREEEKTVNQFFLKLHREEGWPLVAGNDVHYVERKDSPAHDVLLCIEGGWKLNDANRPRFPSDQYYLKSGDEMHALLAEYPDALENTVRIADMCEATVEFGTLYHPNFPIPKGFKDADAYLEKLAMDGLKQRYEKPGAELKERLRFELDTMKRMKVAGYMLIVQDFINAAKERGIPVGPGRGSAVGSIVSYLTGITDVDPVRYNLLFERFL
ncbi:MAG TPA: DNA polymerase III subunit alpha, partial [Fibrobacteres bacterium]|nr:DNA polymerase III subunit alpha [Fibrobacterota bacterium]